MSLEPQTVTSDFASLQSCLVGGDPDQRKRASKVRRRALIISIVLQTTLLAVVVLLPLFAKPPILVPPPTPFPIYGAVSSSSHPTTRQHASVRRPCVVCFNSRPANLNQTQAIQSSQPQDPLGEIGLNDHVAACPNCINIARTEGPRIPIAEPPLQKLRIHEAHIDPALLINRVEPIYPILAIQTRRSGHVELRAIIATDGTIRSLQFVSGDPLFYQSAKEAVSQWRYRPTILNGQAVEIDTFITVIYNINH